MIRYTVHFSGRVQGVGFRYTSCNIADRFQVAGTVQNLPDGRVRLVVEGSKDELDSLVESIAKRLGNYIRDVTIDQSKANGEFGKPMSGGLTVRY